MGDTSRKVFAMVMAEGVVLGLAGSALGVALGVALALGILAIGIPMPPPPNSNLGYVAEIRLVPSVMAAAFVTGLAAAVLASVLPALRACGAEKKTGRSRNRPAPGGLRSVWP